MDTVELVLMVEERFEIQVPDSEAEHLLTPGDLCALVERKLGLRAAEKASYCPTSRAFYTVRRELMSMGIERSQITPRTPLDPLWPRSTRRHNWNALSQSLGVTLPDLERSPEWAFVGLLPLGVLPILLLSSPLLGLWLCLLYALLWKLGIYATLPLALHVPQYPRTVADLSRLLAPRFYNSRIVPQSEIWPLVQGIVSEVCSIPADQVKRDSEFYRDLGMD